MKTSFTALLSIAFFYPLNINAGEYFIALVPDGCYQKVIGNDNEFSKFANMMVDVEKSSVVVYESDYRNIFEIWKVIPDAGYSLRNAKASIRGTPKYVMRAKSLA